MLIVVLIIVALILIIIVVVCKIEGFGTESKGKTESVIPDELTSQIETCLFHLSFPEMLNLPRTKTKERPDGISVFNATLPIKELDVFDRLRLVYFPETDQYPSCWKITFIGNPPISSIFSNFVKMCVWRHGVDTHYREELCDAEVDLINHGERWWGRTWLSKSFAMELSFDESTKEIEMCIGNPIFERSLNSFRFFNKYDREQFEQVEYSIVGMRHRRIPTTVLENFCYGYMKLEPKNRYDPYAIAVFNTDNQKIGYIPKDENFELYEIMNKEPKRKVDVIGHVWEEQEYDGFLNWKGELIIRGYPKMDEKIS